MSEQSSNPYEAIPQQQITVGEDQGVEAFLADVMATDPGQPQVIDPSQQGGFVSDAPAEQPAPQERVLLPEDPAEAYQQPQAQPGQPGQPEEPTGPEVYTAPGEEVPAEGEQPAPATETPFPQVSPEVLNAIGVESVEQFKDVVDIAKDLNASMTQANQAREEAQQYIGQVRAEQQNIEQMYLHNPELLLARWNAVRAQAQLPPVFLSGTHPSQQQQPAQQQYQEDLPDLLNDAPPQQNADPQIQQLMQQVQHLTGVVQQQQQASFENTVQSHEVMRDRVLSEELSTAMATANLAPESDYYLRPAIMNRIANEQGLGAPGPRDPSGNWTSEEAYRQYFKRVALTEAKRMKINLGRAGQGPVARQRQIMQGASRLAGAGGVTPAPNRGAAYQNGPEGDKPMSQFIDEVSQMAQAHQGAQQGSTPLFG